MDDAISGRHPLNVARSDLPDPAGRVAMLDLALVRDGDRFEAFMGMRAEPAPFIARGKMMGRNVIEQ